MTASTRMSLELEKSSVSQFCWRANVGMHVERPASVRDTFFFYETATETAWLLGDPFTNTKRLLQLFHFLKRKQPWLR